MKNKHSHKTKIVKIDNFTWIETGAWIPDEVAKAQFLQKLQLAKANSSGDQANSGNLLLQGLV
jgi:hypothetical protein